MRSNYYRLTLRYASRPLLLTTYLAGVISVVEEDIARVGKLSNSTVMLSQELGGNYMASVEAVHQMPCLVSCVEKSAIGFRLYQDGIFRIYFESSQTESTTLTS
jgi:hypothetical protein